MGVMGSKASVMSRVRTYSEGQASSSGHSSSSSSNGAAGPIHADRSSDADVMSASSSTPATSTFRQRSASTTTPQQWLHSRITFSVAVKCPICSKLVNPDDVEIHLVMCLTRPRIHYNDDVLDVLDVGECAICLDDLEIGQQIARLPCLCIYHKECIDSWWKVNRVCPAHPE